MVIFNNNKDGNLNIKYGNTMDKIRNKYKKELKNKRNDSQFKNLHQWHLKQ